jgi:hypothetical protein
VVTRCNLPIFWQAHACALERERALSDSHAAQREKQFGELLAMEKERQHQDMAQARSFTQ